MKISIIKDLNKEYIEAVTYYEADISSINTITSVDCYINLAFLYWSFAFELFEFNIPNNISDEWSILGGNRYPEILNLGLSVYPNSVELHFWKRYFSRISYGESFLELDCKELIKQYGDFSSHVPYFFLYQFDRGFYFEKTNLLIKECEELPTAKNIYIKSIIA